MSQPARLRPPASITAQLVRQHMPGPPTRDAVWLERTIGVVLEGARAAVDAHAYGKDGAECPVCQRRVQVYRRRFNATYARFLIGLAKLGSAEYHHYTTVPGGPWRGGEYAYSHHWGFIQRQPPLPGIDKQTSGMWRTTPTGLAFAQGRLFVPLYANIRDGKAVSLDGPEVRIWEALKGGPFRYSELVEGAWWL